MKFILGTKAGMTQVFDENGTCHPATMLLVPKNVVTQVKTSATDGYEAVQVATGEQKKQRVGKALTGHLGAAYQHVQEFRARQHQGESLEGLEKGQTLDASVFAVGDKVAVSAVSKGKGFQGVVKRYNFAGGKATHGQKHSHREPGSIGATEPARVFKGKRMAGRMGTDRTTVKNLQVLQVNENENMLLIRGAIPGRKGTLIEVRGV